MTETNTPERKHDILPAELERELFKRFWLWLGVVGTLFSIAVSVVVTFLVQNTVNLASTTAENRIEQLTSRFAEIDSRALQSAQTIGMAQGRSEQAAAVAEQSAKNAASSLKDLSDKLAISQQVLAAADSLSGIADRLKADTTFAGLVSQSVSVKGKIGFRLAQSQQQVQHAEISCGDGEILVSAACVGFNPSAQAAVGPQYAVSGQSIVASCDRYGGDVMPVQATAICLQIK